MFPLMFMAQATGDANEKFCKLLEKYLKRSGIYVLDWANKKPIKLSCRPNKQQIGLKDVGPMAKLLQGNGGIKTARTSFFLIIKEIHDLKEDLANHPITRYQI